MSFSAKILADSISPRGDRITTFEATFPRFVLAEFNTHRVFSRNSASSRAIPIFKQLRRVMNDPFIPLEFGSNQPGMQAGPALTGNAKKTAEEEWLRARDDAVRRVLGLTISPNGSLDHEGTLDRLDEIEEATKSKEIPDRWLNVHKQVANRLLEPFMWHTVIVTATEWDNFWNLRTHSDAQPEIREIAVKMEREWSRSTPSQLGLNEWHLPLIDSDDRASGLPVLDLVRISVGRCARVSYLTHDGKRDLEADIDLHERLASSGHMSPLEHPARPMRGAELERGQWSGNFQGWKSWRKQVHGESDALHQIRIPEDLERTG